mgnify:CR=1 FL=1
MVRGMHKISPEELARRIDHTNLKPNATEDMFIKTINEAIRYGFRGVCLPLSYLDMARRILKKGIRLVTVVGFPLGYYPTQVKVREAKLAEDMGADEIDVVMNISAFKSRKFEWVLRDLRTVVESVSIPVKVIIETSYLDREEIIRACEIVEKSGAFCVKTNTGFGPRGVTVEDVKIIKSVVGSNLKIKASGGIRTYAQALQLIEAGADILGTSSGVKIIEECIRRSS